MHTSCTCICNARWRQLLFAACHFLILTRLTIGSGANFAKISEKIMDAIGWEIGVMGAGEPISEYLQ
jgi:hypothetical protein